MTCKLESLLKQDLMKHKGNLKSFSDVPVLKVFTCILLRKHLCARRSYLRSMKAQNMGKGELKRQKWLKRFPRKWQTEVSGCELDSFLDLSKNIECSRTEVSVYLFVFFPDKAMWHARS